MSKSPKTELLVAHNAIRIINIDEINFDTSYQRGITRKHRKIVSDFNQEALGNPLIAQREDGSLWCVDGQQRITALKKLGKTKVRCEVFTSKGPEHEAEVFKIIHTGRTNLKPLELFNAMLTCGDEYAWLVKNTVEECGFRIPATHQGRNLKTATASKTVLTVNVLLRVAQEIGKEPIVFILETIKNCWPDDVNAVKTPMIQGLEAFWRRHKEGIDTERLYTRLKVTQPARIVYTAGLGAAGIASNVADVIEKFYRKRNAPKK